MQPFLALKHRRHEVHWLQATFALELLQIVNGIFFRGRSTAAREYENSALNSTAIIPDIERLGEQSPRPLISEFLERTPD
ncbi:MAG: hypothetical protein ABIR24_04455 [Verrucomicrobiota bacterium]